MDISFEQVNSFRLNLAINVFVENIAVLLHRVTYYQTPTNFDFLDEFVYVTLSYMVI